MTFRLTPDQLEAFDRLAEGRGGRSGVLRRLVATALAGVNALPNLPQAERSQAGRVTFTLNEAEMGVLEATAKGRGLTRAQWVRALVVRRLRMKGRTDESLRLAIGPIRSELRRIGINLNQAVKIANAAANEAKSDDIADQLEKIIDLRIAVNEQLAAITNAMRGDYDYWAVTE